MANSMLGCTGAATARRRATGLDMAADRGDAAGVQRPDALTQAERDGTQHMTKGASSARAQLAGAALWLACVGGASPCPRGRRGREQQRRRAV
jgi:hypothetical protein